MRIIEPCTLCISFSHLLLWVKNILQDEIIFIACPAIVKWNQWYIFSRYRNALRQTIISNCPIFMAIILYPYLNKSFISRWNSSRMGVKMYMTHRFWLTSLFLLFGHVLTPISDLLHSQNKWFVYVWL